MPKAAFLASMIQIEQIDVSTFGEPLYISGDVTVIGKFLVYGPNGMRYTHDASITLTGEEADAMRSVIARAEQRYRQVMAGALTE